ncbi:MAG: molybdopterin-dependent oxidoreductase [Thermoplasmata archaeon]|nr:MAG: molybdopterin-dependent oxidoreductase [Thermoplasmata archaeon]
MDKGWKIIGVLAIVFGLVIVSILMYPTSLSEITPNDEFFVVSKGPSPIIDADNWTLIVDGLVENPLILNYENITGFPKISEIKTLICVAGPSGTANWTGVRLKALLDMAVLKENAAEVVFYAADGYSSSLTIDYASGSDVILAYEMNGETLPIDHGYPLRLVAPGKYGYKWVKWITHIEVVDYDYKGFWESRGYSDEADVTVIIDWWGHSILLTISAYFGSLALLSGFRFSKHVEFRGKLPEMFSRNFHRKISMIYLIILLPVSIFWSFSALDKRGSFPNSNHGYLALAVMILALIAIISGYLLNKHKENKNIRTVHLTSTLLSFLLLLGTMLTGLILGGVLNIY